MSDRLHSIVSALAALAIVGGGMFAILEHGSRMYSMPSNQAPGAATALTSSSVRPDNLEPAPVGTRESVSSIYRCNDKRTPVYSNQPCANGREIDVRPTTGFNLAPARRVAQRQPYEPAAQATGSGGSVPFQSSATAVQGARCALIDAEIERIDAAARAGGSASYQDQLRERRHKLVDERYALKC